MRTLLLAVPFVALACSSAPEPTSSNASSLCTFDLALQTQDFVGVDVVAVVDDAPSAAASRPLFRSQLARALRRLVAEPPKGVATTSDVRVTVRGASSGFERKLSYLAKTPDNAWKTPQGELRDADAFVKAFEDAFDALPTGTEDAPLLDRFADVKRGDATVRETARLVLLVATAHDDASVKGELPAALDDLHGRRAWATELSILGDVRTFGPSAPVSAAQCRAFDRDDHDAWATPTAFPRLQAAASSSLFRRAQLAQACTPSGETGDLLLQKSYSVVDGQCLPRPKDATCTMFVAPPVSGDDSLCARPELGLTPASSAAREHFARSEDAAAIAGRPLCQLRELPGIEAGGEGFAWTEGTCAPKFTSWSTPVAGSWTFVHCESTLCSR